MFSKWFRSRKQTARLSSGLRRLSTRLEILEDRTVLATLQVASISTIGSALGFTGNVGSGFSVKFNGAAMLDGGTSIATNANDGLNLYTGASGGVLGPRDVEILRDPTGNDFASSDVQSFGPAIQNATQPGTAGDELRFNAVQTAPDTVLFILTGPNRVAASQTLADGAWRIAIRGGSGSDAILLASDSTGLDGDGNGTVAATDNFVTGQAGGLPDVTVVAPPANAVVVSIGDIIRGPGQSFDVPLVISTGVGVTSVDLGNTNSGIVPGIVLPSWLSFDTTVGSDGFQVNSATGASAAFNASTGILTMSSGSQFSSTAGPLLLGTFRVKVAGLTNSGTAPGIGTKSLIDITVSSVGDANIQPREGYDDDGLAVAAYTGDVASATGVYNGIDTSRLQQFITGSIQAFELYQNLDPRAIADVNGDGTVNGIDVSQLQSRITGGTSTVPTLPTGSAGVAAAGPDPKIFVRSGLKFAPGQTAILIPIDVTNTDTTAITVAAGDVALAYDTTRFTFTGVVAGTGSIAEAGGYSVFGNETVAGVVTATGSSASGPTLAVGETKTLYFFRFDVKANAPLGNAQFNIRKSAPVEAGGNPNYTILGNNAGQQLTLVPDPKDSFDAAAEDATVEITQVTARVFADVNVPGVAGSSVVVPIRVDVGSFAQSIAVADVGIKFDATKLSFVSVAAGTATAGFSIAAGNTVSGELLITGSSATGNTVAANTTATLYLVTFNVLAAAQAGDVLAVNITDNVSTGNTNYTILSDGTKEIALSPAQTDGFDANVDGTIVVSVILNQPPFVKVPASSLNATTNTVTTMAGRGLVFSGTTAVTVSDPNANDTKIRMNLTVPTGTLKLGSLANISVVSGVGDGTTGTVVIEGTAANLTTALNGLTYRSPATFAGNVVLTITANDQSGNFGGPLTDTKYVNITVVRAYINEVMFNPQSATDTPNEYVEIRTSLPNYTFPANTFLVGIEANGTGASAGTNSGGVDELFVLAGKSTGANGILLLRQLNSTWATDPNANVITSSATGWTGANIGFSTNTASKNDIEEGGVTFLLLTVDDGSSTNPSLATDIDANNDGTVDGTQYATWAINDSVGVLTTADSTTTPNFGYGAVNFRPTPTSGAGGSSPTGTLVTYPGTWLAGYVARVGNSTGSTSTDWLVSDAQSTVGTTPTTWAIPANTFTGATGTYVGKLFNSQTARPNLYLNAISGVQIAGGDAQRSQITSITITFNSPVTAVDASKITLTGWRGAVTTSVALASDGLSATVTFVDGNATDDVYTLADQFNGSATALKDGKYTLVIAAGAFTDGAGGIDIDGDGSPGGTLTVNFHRLFGDTDGDGDVDASDRGAFNGMVDNNDNESGTPDGKINNLDNPYFAYLDYSNDNNIDRGTTGAGATGPDYANFLANFRRRRLTDLATYLAGGPDL